MIKSLFAFLMLLCINIYSAEQLPSDALNYLCQGGNPRTPTAEEFLHVVDTFNEKMMGLLDMERVESGMYVQQEFFPSGSRVFFIGDIHGCLSLFRNFEYMRSNGLLEGDNVYWIFLGDYTDGGPFSIEVLFGLIKFKLEHWDNVFLLMGNHETINMAYRYGLLGYDSGKESELELKFRTNYQDVRESLKSFICMLPVALYIGSGNPLTPDWIQCCHGGIEPTFNPKDFLQNDSGATYYSIQDTLECGQEGVSGFDFKRAIDLFYHQFSETEDCGLNWCDFCDNAVRFGCTRSRGYKCNPAQITRMYLDPCGLKAIVRGHQDLDFGLKIGGQKHWTEFFPGAERAAPGEFSFRLNQIAAYPVLTLSTAAGVKGRYDCFGLLQTADSYDNWTFTPYERLAPLTE